MKRSIIAAVSACALVVAGCGGGSSHISVPPKIVQQIRTIVAQAVACPQAVSGNGAPGVCAPVSLLPRFRSNLHLAGDSGPTYPDLSNNDPCYCGAALKAQGRVGLIVKANQGTGFIDSTAVGMVQSARAAGLAVGAYDFDQDYSIAEAQVFVSRLHAMGIYPSTLNTFPAYLDVEFGNFNYGGLLAQIAYLRSQGYRVGIYTGEWYWGPHAGSRWPSGVSAWISGYPFAPTVPGLPDVLYNAHQFTDVPTDLSVFRGPGSFAQFVNATPPGPSVATISRWRSHRNVAFDLYRQHGCKAPQQSVFCEHAAEGVIAYQKALWGVYPRWALFGPRASHLHSAIAWVIRPEANYWSSARDASRHAFVSHVCGGASGTQGLTKDCRVWKQRADWFGSHATALVRAYS